MFRKLTFILSVCTICVIILTGCGYSGSVSLNDNKASVKGRDVKLKPFRVLVVIGDQWLDPLSYAIDGRRVKGEDFLDVVTMLKIWGVPFDILRLDQQRLQINRFLDGEAKPNYGCIIWMADPATLKGASANFQTLKRAVEEYGISMIALFDNIKTKEIADLAGVILKDSKTAQSVLSAEKFSVTGKHFITSETTGISIPDKSRDALRILNCTATDSTIVLGTIGNVPQFTVRDLKNDTRVVWIGGGKDWYRKYPEMRKIFRKALVYSMGYGLFNDNFENGFIFIMDDIGCADHSWFLKWHYPTPPKDTLMKYLIEPLEKHGLIMVQCITSGFLDMEKKMIVSPWTVKPFRDIYGNWQDYGSSKAGLDEGIKRGVFEIQHDRAWSHMNWDLDSPPGSFWDSPVDGQKNNGDWYNEVSDITRGNKPVPANDLLFIYKSGIDAVKKAFGVVPIDAEIYPSGDIGEGTHGGDDNGRIAAIAGLGMGRESYVGFDHTIEFKMMFPEQFTCHDLDLTVRTDDPADQMGEWSDCWPKVEARTKDQLLASKIAGVRSVNLHNQDWIESRLDKHWMGYNETCAYLHTKIERTEDNVISLFYDGHYCNHFGKKTSSWTLELSDNLNKSIGSNAVIEIDGTNSNIVPALTQKIVIPTGIGQHSIRLTRNK
jgi:hypothetical protein